MFTVKVTVYENGKEIDAQEIHDVAKSIDVVEETAVRCARFVVKRFKILLGEN